jgi:hypothetical protein
MRVTHFALLMTFLLGCSRAAPEPVETPMATPAPAQPAAAPASEPLKDEAASPVEPTIDSVTVSPEAKKVVAKKPKQKRPAGDTRCPANQVWCGGRTMGVCCGEHAVCCNVPGRTPKCGYGMRPCY